MNATHLIIPGYKAEKSPYRCCICGDYADGTQRGVDYFGSIFRDYREMKCRLSEYICKPCALSLKDVPGGVVRYIDGSTKTPKTEKRGLGWRFFSWILVEDEDPIGATKAHCDKIVDFLKNPPIHKHFAVVIAESGQKQLIYRIEAQYINSIGTPYQVQYETEKVTIDDVFFKILDTANKISSVVGKMRVLLANDYVTASAFFQKYGDSFDEYDQFLRHINTPEARLSAFLCKGKET